MSESRRSITSIILEQDALSDSPKFTTVDTHYCSACGARVADPVRANWHGCPSCGEYARLFVQRQIVRVRE